MYPQLRYVCLTLTALSLGCGPSTQRSTLQPQQQPVTTVTVPSASASAANLASPTPPAQKRKLFDELFVNGGQWRYQLTVTSQFWDDQHPQADPKGWVHTTRKGTMTCRVTRVARVGTAQVAQLSCERTIGIPIGDVEPDGYYILTERGLFRRGSMPSETDITALLTNDWVLPRKPQAWSDKKEYPEGGGEAKQVKHTADGWCVEYSSWGGDEGGWSLCFANGHIRSGSHFFAGGSVHEVKFRELPG